MTQKKFTRKEIEEIKKQKLGGNIQIRKAMIVRPLPSSLNKDKEKKEQNSKDNSDSTKKSD